MLSRFKAKKKKKKEGAGTQRGVGDMMHISCVMNDRGSEELYRATVNLLASLFKMPKTSKTLVGTS